MALALALVIHSSPHLGFCTLFWWSRGGARRGGSYMAACKGWVLGHVLPSAPPCFWPWMAGSKVGRRMSN